MMNQRGSHGGRTLGRECDQGEEHGSSCFPHILFSRRSAATDGGHMRRLTPERNHCANPGAARVVGIPRIRLDNDNGSTIA